MYEHSPHINKHKKNDRKKKGGEGERATKHMRARACMPARTDASSFPPYESPSSQPSSKLGCRAVGPVRARQGLCLTK